MYMKNITESEDRHKFWQRARTICNLHSCFNFALVFSWSDARNFFMYVIIKSIVSENNLYCSHLQVFVVFFIWVDQRNIFFNIWFKIWNNSHKCRTKTGVSVTFSMRLRPKGDRKAKLKYASLDAGQTDDIKRSYRLGYTAGNQLVLKILERKKKLHLL